jgi:hypothetical protein
MDAQIDGRLFAFADGAIRVQIVRKCVWDQMRGHPGDSYFLSRRAADALAADLSSFAEFPALRGLAAFFTEGLFFTDGRLFAGFTFADLADFFAIVARN